jgi:hypothetical protein
MVDNGRLRVDLMHLRKAAKQIVDEFEEAIHILFFEKPTHVYIQSP